MPTTSELACSTATKTLARPSRTVIVCVMSVPHISLTLSVMIVPSCGLVSVRPTRCGAGRSRASPVAHDAGWCERQQSATAPITCGSPRREGGRPLCAGGYALPVPRPSMRRLGQDDGRSYSAACPCESDRRWRARTSTRAQRAPCHTSVPRRARVSGSSSRPPVGQRAFTLQRLDLGVEQFVVHGDLAHLGFQPGDLVVAVIAFAFFQGCSRACQRT